MKKKSEFQIKVRNCKLIINKLLIKLSFKVNKNKMKIILTILLRKKFNLKNKKLINFKIFK